MSYDPNYFSGFTASAPSRSIKQLTSFSTVFGGNLSLKQNLSINRPYILYENAQRNPTAVLTNNVTTLPQGNGAQFMGYGYISGTNGSININV